MGRAVRMVFVDVDCWTLFCLLVLSMQGEWEGATVLAERDTSLTFTLQGHDMCNLHYFSLSTRYCRSQTKHRSLPHGFPPFNFLYTLECCKPQQRHRFSSSTSVSAST